MIDLNLLINMLCILLLICYVFCYFHELFFSEHSRVLKVVNLSNWIIFFKVCVCWTSRIETFWPFFVDGVQLLQGYRVTMTREFLPLSLQKFALLKDLSQPWSLPLVFNSGPPGLRFQRLNQEAIVQQINVYFQYPKKT